MRFTDVVSDPVGLADRDRVTDTVPVTVEGLLEAIEAVAFRLFELGPEPVPLDVIATEGVA